MEEREFLNVIAFITFSAIAFFIYVRRRYTYFERKKLPAPNTPQLPFGNVESIVFQQESLNQTIWRNYIRYGKKKVKFGGIYVFMQPALVVTHPALIYKMLNSNCFEVSSFFRWLNYESLVGVPSYKAGLGEFFSYKNLNSLVGTIEGKSGLLAGRLLDESKNDRSTNLGDVLQRYLVDSSAALFFGEKFQSNDYYAICEEYKCTSSREMLFSLWCPKFYSLFKSVFYTDNAVKKLTSALSGACTDDANSNALFFHLIKDKRFSAEDLEWMLQILQSNTNLTTNAILFCIYELSLNDEIQDDLRGDILRFVKSGKASTYENLMELSYLETVINETLRKYPIYPVIIRICTKDYKNAEYNLEVAKGTPVFVPIYGMHHDATLYINPENFDPDRFSEENRKYIKPYSYMPFGCGPRNCLAFRLVSFQIKLALISMLGKFKFSLSKKTKFEFDNKSFVLAPKSPLFFNIEAIAADEI